MTARPWIVRSLVAIAVAGIVLAIGWSRLDGFRPLPLTEHSLRPDDPAVLALGEPIYVAHCAACHGAKLEGQPDWKQRRPDGRLPAPPHDETGHTWHHPDEQLVRMTRLGVARAAGLNDHASDMPAFEGVLTDAEIIAVLSWIKSRWPAAVRVQHDAINRRMHAGH
ncbi:MAG: cytochrome c [Burkholderiales bacterium]|nr:cytochrome c [Burkholderiales bacterium]